MRCSSIIMYAVGQAHKEGRGVDAQPAFQAATQPKPEGHTEAKPDSIQQGQSQQTFGNGSDPRLTHR